MPKKIYSLTLSLFLVSSILVAQPNGTIIDKQEISNDSLLNSFAGLKDPDRFILKKKSGLRWNKDWEHMNDLVLYRITYMSDGFKVTGYLYEPKADGKYPCIIYNRGGNRDFGMMNPTKMVFLTKDLVKTGYIAIASNYRGVDGGEGIEEFGGKDINDVLNLIPLLEQHPKADAEVIGLYGWSRGAMMSFLALKQSDVFKAVVVGGALVDLRDEKRPEMESNVYAELIPNYWDNKEEKLDQRSAVQWADKLPKNIPILIMHGTADWRVPPESALMMAGQLQKYRVPYRLIMMEGGDHGLSEHRKEVRELTVTWFDRFLKNKEALPNLEPHGR